MHMVRLKEVESARGLKHELPIVAPTLPIAALKPLRVVRTFEGKVSDGRAKVVELGPKFEKKKVKP